MADRAPSSDEPVDTAAVLEETLAFLTVRPGEQADDDVGDTWVAETPDTSYEFATDTFVVQNGKIVAQSFAAKTKAKR